MFDRNGQAIGVSIIRALSLVKNERKGNEAGRRNLHKQDGE